MREGGRGRIKKGNRDGSMERQTDRQTETKTRRERGRETQAGAQAGRQAGRQTDTHSNRQTEPNFCFNRQNSSQMQRSKIILVIIKTIELLHGTKPSSF